LAEPGKDAYPNYNSAGNQADIFKKSIINEKGYQRLQRLGNKKIGKFRSEILRVREIQASQLPRFDKIANFDISSSFLPADDLSGDFIDGYFVAEDIYQLVLCDVSGHGFSSSYIGTTIRSMFRTLSMNRKILSPSSLTERVNNLVVSDLATLGFFATVIVCHIDIVKGEVKYCSGGHPPSIFFNSEKNQIFSIDGTGPLVGMQKNVHFGTRKLKIKPGDVLFLYTDGIIDALAEDDEERYGAERLIDNFQKNVGNSSIEVLHDILNSYFSFTNFRGQIDDISLVCIKKYK
jgi:sigma-B regulation protein RsbU (phosphoserine phosphatase)